MSSPKIRKAVPLTQTVEVDTTQVNVAVEGIDPTRLGGSFKVHLLKNGQRIASRFLFRPSGDPDASPEASANVRSAAEQLAHFDFLLPIEAIAEGELSIEVELLEGEGIGKLISPSLMGHPTLSVHLMLQIRS